MYSMSPLRNRRRKEDRPDEIADAAFEAFASNGFDRTRLDDVARRAGVSKGLLYVYYKTKEELFKAVIRRVVSPYVDTLSKRLEQSDESAEALLRGPVQSFMQQLPDTPARIVVKLMISEGARHPDLLDYYWDNVASRGMAMIQSIVQRGVDRGEFRQSAVTDLPQLVVSPMLVAMIWKIVFAERSLDTDRLVETHVDMLLTFLKADAT